jgi:hypothetical protein
LIHCELVGLQLARVVIENLIAIFLDKLTAFSVERSLAETHAIVSALWLLAEGTKSFQ